MTEALLRIENLSLPRKGYEALRSVNPFDPLVRPACRIDDDKAHSVFAG